MADEDTLLLAPNPSLLLTQPLLPTSTQERDIVETVPTASVAVNIDAATISAIAADTAAAVASANAITANVAAITANVATITAAIAAAVSNTTATTNTATGPPAVATDPTAAENPQGANNYGENGWWRRCLPDWLPFNARGNGWWRRRLPNWLPLSDGATAAFLSKVADTLVMGLVTLVTFIATYLLAWGKPGSTFIPSFNVTKSSGLSWEQVFIAPLAFAIFPVALFFNGFAKAAEKDSRLLNFVASFCLAEFMVVIFLGAGMTYCVAGAPAFPVALVTLFLLALLAVIWGFTFKYPMCLRWFIWKRCFCQDDDAAQGPAPGGGQ